MEIRIFIDIGIVLLWGPDEWEIWSDEKIRMQDCPEYHPALGIDVPDYSFHDGTSASASRELLIDRETNRSLVKQIVLMYNAIEENKNKDLNDRHKEEGQEELYITKGDSFLPK